MKKQFIIYNNHNEVRCFNCNSDISNSLSTLTLYEEGAYMKYCDNCAMYTFYDIGRKNEVIRSNQKISR